MNPTANIWTGAFRRTRVNAYAHTIEAEFIAAPDNYCFEAYDVSDFSIVKHLHNVTFVDYPTTARFAQRRHFIS